MAQSASNLTISIGVDNAKLDADIRLAKAKLQELGRAANAAAKEGVKTGDRAAVDAASQAYNKQEQVLRGLTREKKAFAVATNEATAAQVRENRATGESIRYLLEFGRAAGITTVRVRDLRLGIAGFASAEVVKSISDVIQKMNDLNNAVREGGGATGGGRAGAAALKEMQSTARGTGQEADIATRFWAGFNKSLDESREKTEAAGGALENATGTIQSLQRVLRGGQTQQIDWTDPLQTALGVNTSKARANLDVMRDAAKAILSDTDALSRNTATQKTFNVTYEQGLELLRKAAAGEFKMPEPPSSKPLDDWNTNLEKVRRTFRDMVEEAVTALLPSLITGLQTVNTELVKMQENLKINWGPFVTEAGKAFDTLGARALAFHRLLQSIPIIGQFISSKGYNPPEEPAEPQRPVVPSYGAQLGEPWSVPTVLPPRASGGYIRGPGSATSDSILARLSNGEFVLNARAVSRLGIGVLNRLNRYQAGGGVDIIRPKRSADTGPIDYSWMFDFDPSRYDWQPWKPGSWLQKKFQAARSNWRAKWGAGSPGFVPGSLISIGGGEPETPEKYRARTGYPYGARSTDPAGTGSIGGLLRELLIGGFDPSRFALGGLVGAPPIRFAEGGLVSAASSSGRPVHLHLGSQSFALSGSSGVVDALVSHAHSQQIRSAGVKPSWFAGRPSGR
jgi:hypothetical protein